MDKMTKMASLPKRYPVDTLAMASVGVSRYCRQVASSLKFQKGYRLVSATKARMKAREMMAKYIWSTMLIHLPICHRLTRTNKNGRIEK